MPPRRHAILLRAVGKRSSRGNGIVDSNRTRSKQGETSMNRLFSLLAVVAALSLLGGCSNEADMAQSEASAASRVNYEVLMNSVGSIKITYKDAAGQLIVEEEVSAPMVGHVWEKEYMSKGGVDALLMVELADSAPPDPVGVEFFIAVNGERVQKATKFLTKQKGMTLKVTRP